MLIQSFPSGPFETNAYVVACAETHEAAILDPAPYSAAAVIAFIKEKQLKPRFLILTHSHWDHIADAVSLKATFHTPIYVHPLDEPNLKSPGADQLPYWIPIEGVLADKFLNEGDTVVLGKVKFEVIHTPGHTPGGICLWCREEGILFSGDTLFQGSFGNISFPTSDPQAMWESLAKLAKLPSDTIVYPGHGSPTLIGKESWLSHAKQYFGGNSL